MSYMKWVFDNLKLANKQNKLLKIGIVTAFLLMLPCYGIVFGNSLAWIIGFPLYLFGCSSYIIYLQQVKNK